MRLNILLAILVFGSMSMVFPGLQQYFLFIGGSMLIMTTISNVEWFMIDYIYIAMTISVVTIMLMVDKKRGNLWQRSEK